ncbi:hypothetical protein [Pengzhenrongella sp.]|jgi:hypothetical protein|uniref:hypothetical protein n=1 Tax=Pengzhenrongella sp. TaxID=2888820 RepID=UPI002F951836
MAVTLGDPTDAAAGEGPNRGRGGVWVARVMAVRRYLETHRTGHLNDGDDETEIDDRIASWAAELQSLGAACAPGTVIERWWDTLTPRGSGPLGPQSRPGRRRTRW